MRKIIPVQKILTDSEYQRLFVRAIFIGPVLNPSNAKAKAVIRLCRKHLSAEICATLARQTMDLQLRRKWLSAKANGEKLPKVHPAVLDHFEFEFNRTYPQGINYVEPDPESTVSDSTPLVMGLTPWIDQIPDAIGGYCHA